MSKATYYRINGLMLMISWTVFLYLNAHYLLYNDEMATMMEIRMPFGDMMRFLLTEDIHLPAYYVLLKMWMFVFGDSVFSARCFSYAGLAACAFGGGYMVRRLYGDKAGLWFAALFLFLPVSFWFAKTIRMYSWACFFCSASLLSAQAALMKNERKDYVLYVVFSFLGAWTHYYASFLCAVIAGVFSVLSWKKDGDVFKKFFIANAVLFLTVCPQIYLFLRQNVGGTDWITKEHASEAWRDFFLFYDGRGFFYNASAFAMVALWILGLRFLLDGRKSEEKSFAKKGLWTSLLFFAVLLTVSLTVKPCLVGRYLWISCGGIYVFFLFGFLNDRGGRILVGLLLAFSFVSQISLSKKVLNESVQPSFYQAVKRHVTPDDVIVATDWMIAYWFYFRFPDYDVRVLPSGTERLLGKKQRRIDEAGILELLKTKNVFVTTGVQGETKVEELFNGFDAYMGRSFILNKIDRAQFYGAENVSR